MDASKMIIAIHGLRLAIHQTEPGYQKPHEYMNMGDYPLKALSLFSLGFYKMGDIPSRKYALQHALACLETAERLVSKDTCNAYTLIGVAVGIMTVQGIDTAKAQELGNEDEAARMTLASLFSPKVPKPAVRV